MRRILFLDGVVLGVALAGCGDPQVPSRQVPSNQVTLHTELFQRKNDKIFGRTLNPLRKEIGLRLIDDDWSLYRAEGNQEDWKIMKGHGLAKSVFKDASGSIESEEDYYFSGAEYTDHEGHGWERITVHYDFRSKQMYIYYSGTNGATAAILEKYLITNPERATDPVGAMAAVKKATAGWPNGPK